MKILTFGCWGLLITRNLSLKASTTSIFLVPLALRQIRRHQKSPISKRIFLSSAPNSQNLQGYVHFLFGKSFFTKDVFRNILWSEVWKGAADFGPHSYTDYVLCIFKQHWVGRRDFVSTGALAPAILSKRIFYVHHKSKYLLRWHIVNIYFLKRDSFKTSTMILRNHQARTHMFRIVEFHASIEILTNAKKSNLFVTSKKNRNHQFTNLQ